MQATAKLDKDFLASLLEELQAILPKYKNGYLRVEEKLFSVLESDLQISEKSVDIPNWTALFTHLGGGDCVDLARAFLIELKSEGKLNRIEDHGFQVVYAEGTEPSFFHSTDDNHAFVLIKHQNVSFVIDPALQQLSDFSKTGYKIRETKSVAEILNFDRGSNRKLDLREVDIFDKESVLSSLMELETAVIGLVDSRSIAVSLGFIKNAKQVLPLLKIVSQLNTFFILPTGDDVVSIVPNSIELDEVQKQEIDKLIKIVKNRKYETRPTE